MSASSWHRFLSVKSRFERFIALRYLSGAEGRQEGKSFLRFVMYVAIGGVALGVAALLLALAIVRGFSREIENKIVGFGAHVQVLSYVQDNELQDAPGLRSEISKMRGVARVAPVVEQPVLLRRSKTSIDGVVLLGVDRAPTYLKERIVEGDFELTRQSRDHRGLVIGREMAQNLGLEVGDLVTAFALSTSDSEERGLGVRPPRVTQFRVRGIYNTSLKNIDDVYVFADLGTARRLGRVSQMSVSRLNVTVHDPSTIDSLAAQIENRFGFPIATRTVYEQYVGLFAWVNLQQSIIPLVIGVIVIVAAFNIIGTLLMLMLEKTREIGVLQSIGASGATLKRLFLVLGLLIGGVGAGIGATIALLLSIIQQQFEVIPLPAEAYYMTSAPIEMNPVDYLIVVLVALVLCGAAAYVPARVASRIEPVRAIRFE